MAAEESCTGVGALEPREGSRLGRPAPAALLCTWHIDSRMVEALCRGPLVSDVAGASACGEPARSRGSLHDSGPLANLDGMWEAHFASKHLNGRHCRGGRARYQFRALPRRVPVSVAIPEDSPLDEQSCSGPSDEEESSDLEALQHMWNPHREVAGMWCKGVPKRGQADIPCIGDSSVWPELAGAQLRSSDPADVMSVASSWLQVERDSDLSGNDDDMESWSMVSDVAADLGCPSCADSEGEDSGCRRTVAVPSARPAASWADLFGGVAPMPSPLAPGRCMMPARRERPAAFMQQDSGHDSVVEELACRRQWPTFRRGGQQRLRTERGAGGRKR